MRKPPKLLIADKKGKIFDVPYLEAAGMKAGKSFRLEEKDLVKLPLESELFMLPDRKPVGYSPERGGFIQLENSPLTKKREKVFPAAAFLSPGYTATYSSLYTEKGKKKTLPLFSYGAAAFYKGGLYAACIRVDRERRQELKLMDLSTIQKNVKAFKKLFPGNRLVKHLQRCALSYSCPAAKNFFLKRYEAPLPTSPMCNAKCLGCISYQPKRSCPVTQPRIEFIPTPEEVAEIALFHIKEVKDPVVSFGQGCEGEPLLAAEVIEEAVKLIRKKTSKGIININTNASRPDHVRRLFERGMDSMRVSINSFQEKHYAAYYLPSGYGFKDVLRSIKSAKKQGGFISINYLVMPGFTDWRKEVNAFEAFLKKEEVDMIQWRNLNYDPREYFRKLKLDIKETEMIGISQLVRMIKKKYPSLMHGYFNPSRGRMKRGGYFDKKAL